MNAHYTIGPLRVDQIERAYVVMHAAMPDLPFESWRGAVSGVAERHNYTVAIDPAGYVRGLCLVRLRDHPLAGRLLDVPIFIAASPIDEADVARRLFAVTMKRARQMHCGHVRFWTLRPENWERLADGTFADRWDHGVICRISPDAQPSSFAVKT